MHLYDVHYFIPGDEACVTVNAKSAHDAVIVAMTVHELSETQVFRVQPHEPIASPCYREALEMLEKGE